MTDAADTNAEIWRSDATAREWAASAPQREALRAEHWRLLAKLLPFPAGEAFRFLDLGAGTGAATRRILERYPRATAVLTDFAPQMIAEGTRELAPFSGRFSYVEFDMASGPWPAAVGEDLDAVVTSLCVHHLPDERKKTLFVEILEHLRPGGWYLNYDPVSAADPSVAATWERVGDIDDPTAPERRAHRSEHERARYENHVRYMVPLEPQLGFLADAGFTAIDVYWKYLENVIYGGCRPG